MKNRSPTKKKKEEDQEEVEAVTRAVVDGDDDEDDEDNQTIHASGLDDQDDSISAKAETNFTSPANTSVCRGYKA